MLEYPKKIAWWCGTDALKLIKYPPGRTIWKVRIFLHRIFWRISHRFFEHWVKSEMLREALVEFGINSRVVGNFDYTPTLYYRCPKPDEFYILFYRPYSKRNQEYKDWLCGWVEYEKVIKEFIKKHEKATPLVVDGSANMDTIYPIIDVYIRMNSWDGDPKMVKECIANKIPTIQSTIGRLVYEFLEKEYEKKFNPIRFL